MPPQALAERLAQPELLARTCLRFAPAVQLVRSAYPVVSLWQAHQTDGEVELAGIDLACGEAALLVRPQWTVQIVPTTLQTADFLAALIAGASLGTAFESSGLQGEHPLIDTFQCLLANTALTALEHAADPWLSQAGRGRHGGVGTGTGNTASVRPTSTHGARITGMMTGHA